MVANCLIKPFNLYIYCYIFGVWCCVLLFKDYFIHIEISIKGVHFQIQTCFRHGVRGVDLMGNVIVKSKCSTEGYHTVFFGRHKGAFTRNKSA